MNMNRLASESTLLFRLKKRFRTQPLQHQEEILIGVCEISIVGLFMNSTSRFRDALSPLEGCFAFRLMALPPLASSRGY